MEQKKNTTTNEIIADKILFIRNQKVLLDTDLAVLYGTTTKRLNEQVKRNQNRFPSNFMFQLTKAEKEQVVANCDHLENLKFSSRNPYAFTEHGTLMLANVLRSPKAISASIRIVETFIKMRSLLTTDLKLQVAIEDIHKKLKGHDKSIAVVFQYLEEMHRKKTSPRKKIGYTTEK